MLNYPNLQLLVGSAGLDKTLRDRLLNGDRRRVLAAFNLSQAEREAVLAVEADSLHAFAQALLCWMERQNGTQPS
jgi:hypothetical protein